MTSLFGNLYEGNLYEHDLAQVVSRLHSSGKWSDMVIKCGDRTWNVHKAIVCSQSAPLAAAFKHGFKEAETGEITLEEDEPEVVDLMIQFLYTSKYKDSSKEDKSTSATPSPKPTSDSFQSAGAAGLFNPPKTVPNLASSPAIPTPVSSGLLFGGRSNSPINPAPTGDVFRFPTSFDQPRVPSFDQLFGSRPSPAVPSGALFVNSNVTVTPAAQPSSRSGGSLFSIPKSSTNNLLAKVTPPAHLEKALIENVKVYILAEKYDISPLRYFAKQKYAELVSECWNGPAFIESLRLLYDEMTDINSVGIRQVAIKVAGEHVKVLLDNKDFLSLCREHGDIATDILKASLGRY